MGAQILGEVVSPDSRFGLAPYPSTLLRTRQASWKLGLIPALFLSQAQIMSELERI